MSSPLPPPQGSADDSSSSPSLPSTSDLADNVQRLLDAVSHGGSAAKLTDADLADQVIDQLYGRYPVGSLEWCLLDELLYRFEASIGIQRDDRGEVTRGGGSITKEREGWKS